MTDTTYIATDYGSNIRGYILEAMGGFDSDYYRAEIARVGVDAVALDDWATFWTQGDETHATEAAAREYADENGKAHVLEIGIVDVRDALMRAFGSAE